MIEVVPGGLSESPEQLAWDMDGERLREREHKGYLITLRKRTDGLFLAKFYQFGGNRAPQRFLGETASQAEQFAVDYIDQQLSPDRDNAAGLILLGNRNDSAQR